MNNPDDLRSYAELAGFENVAVQKVTLEGESPTAMDAAIGFVEGNAIIHEILKEGSELLQTIKTTIVEKINAQVSSDPVRSKLNAWFGEAFKWWLSGPVRILDSLKLVNDTNSIKD